MKIATSFQDQLIAGILILLLNEILVFFLGTDPIIPDKFLRNQWKLNL
jgi:hypothetical protein